MQGFRPITPEEARGGGHGGDAQLAKLLDQINAALLNGLRSFEIGNGDSSAVIIPERYVSAVMAAYSGVWICSRTRQAGPNATSWDPYEIEVLTFSAP